MIQGGSEDLDDQMWRWEGRGGNIGETEGIIHLNISEFKLNGIVLFQEALLFVQ